MRAVFGMIAALALAGPPAAAQDWLKPQTDASLAAAAKPREENPNRPIPWWSEISQRPDAWYRTDEGRRMAANILSWQDHAVGGWPLMNTTREPFTGDATKAGPWGMRAALIKATVNEVRFLARAQRATGDAKARQAALDGIGFILKAQYPSGGWPHSYPLRDDYSKWATNNDDMMPDLMRLLDEVASAPDFAFVPARTRAAAKDAYARGVDFLLKSQIRVDGKLTAWAQQHDPVTYAPRPARVFEPVAITGGESASVLLMLMSIKQPSPQVKAAIEAGVAWYHRSEIDGLKLTQTKDDRAVTPDPAAPPLWARFYEIATNRPIFVGRDGVIRYALAEIDQERRGGYAWYNRSGTEVFRAYDRWRAANGGG